MIDRDTIIKKAKLVHGDKYDYSLVEDVKNVNCKIKYVCKKHNVVCEQSVYNHLQGKGCQVCAKEARRNGRLISKQDFIARAKKVHDVENYDFSKVNFSERDENGNIRIYCKEHGYFSIRPSHFLNGVGCQYCNGRQKNIDNVVKNLSEKHPEYDFSNTELPSIKNNYTIKFICPSHGEKYVSYYNLMNGCGCDECSNMLSGLKHRLSNEEIIYRATEIYGSLYTYEKLDTFNRGSNDEVIVTCKEHGDFTVNLRNFINGKSSCPKCHRHSLETRVSSFLDKNGILYETQKTFDWLIYKSNLYLDFFLPEYNIAIECQGIQHFIPVDIWGGEDYYNLIIDRDSKKKTLCEKHNVKLLYFMESRYKRTLDDFSSLKELLGRIKQG